MSDATLPAPIHIQEIPVHPITKSQLIKAIVTWSREQSQRRIYNVNIHAMNIAHREPLFKESLQAADLVYCDGAGVLLAARVLRQRIPERLTVMDWFDDVLAALAGAGASVFLLGDEDTVVRQTAATAVRRHPDLDVTGYRSGFFDPSDEASGKIASQVLSAHPNVIFVGMGMPRQEFWIDANLDRLPPGVYVPVGAAFRWYSGKKRRPSLALRLVGLEWLGRLVMEPRRLWRRYLIGNPAFAWRIVRDLLRGRK